MENIFIVKIGKKYLRFNHRDNSVLTEELELAQIFYSLKKAEDAIRIETEEGKYLKSKKSIIKYKLVLEDEIKMN